MRLAQFARKYGITQNEIVELLIKDGEEFDTRGNAKLREDQIEILSDHFNISVEKNITSTEKQQITEEELEVEEKQSENEPSDELKSEEHLDLKNGNKERVSVDPKHEETQTSEEPAKSIEVIKAKKIKLEGVKVVGKIEVPEKPSKETVEEDKEESRSKKASRVRKSPSKKRPSHRAKLSYEEKLKREKKKQEERKAKRKKQIKEKKKEHYYKNVQPKTQSTKPKPKKKKHIETRVKKEKPTYKNPVKRFWAWLNGEYDV